MVGMGTDIGSAATKVAVVDEPGGLVHTVMMPTGFSSVDAAARVRDELEAAGFAVGAPVSRGARGGRAWVGCRVRWPPDALASGCH